jgi:protein-S-isoprenylcysteine O-methyltransferase Ste14
MMKLILFVLGSAGIVTLSWSSLRNPRQHGFFRFFAFETLLVLVLSNVDRWFLHPLAFNQVLSWIFLATSLLLAIHGFYLLRIIGRPQGHFENTTALVIVGAYRYIRHPLYSSLVFGAWGVFFKDLTLLGGLLSIVTCVFLDATAKVEESENLAKFGTDYERYMKTTKRFIPFVY